MMRLVRVFPTLIMEPTVQLCHGDPVGPRVQALPTLLVIAVLVGPLVPLRPGLLGDRHICGPWARWVRAMAALISPQPSLSCWPRRCSLKHNQEIKKVQ